MHIIRGNVFPAMIKNKLTAAIRCASPNTCTGIRTSVGRSFATIGAEGSDSDFAPKKSAPVSNQGRDVASEIKQVSKFVAFILGLS